MIFHHGFEIPCGLKITKLNYTICLVVDLLWTVITNKTIVQQNRTETLHHNGNPLKQKRRCSNVPGRLHQSPAAQLTQELKSIPVDWAQFIYLRSLLFVPFWWQTVRCLTRCFCHTQCRSIRSFRQPTNATANCPHSNHSLSAYAHN